MSFQSAEAVTRFLRAKGLTPEEVVATSEQLLLDKLPIYLPNRTHFVFELLCDRMNDTSGFGKWKLHAGLWRLWQAVWVDLDAEVRSKIFRKVKFVAVVSAVLETSTDYELLEQLFSTVDTIMATGYVDVDEYAVVGLLASYSKLIVQSETTWSDNELKAVGQWTNTVSVLFNLPRQSTTYKPTKKSTVRYFGDVLPTTLDLLASHRNASLQTTYDVFEGINSSVLFTDLALKTHIDTLMSKELTQEAVEYFFHQVISHLAAKDIAACESAYLSITSTQHFPNLAEHLLGVLSKINRALSSDFFKLIYDTEMAKDAVRWPLVSHLVRLDADLAVLTWKDVVERSKNLKVADVNALAKSLADGFVKARDFSKFILEVYPSAFEQNPAWGDEKILFALAPLVNEMSGNQISALVKQFLEAEKQMSLSLLVRGLLSCPLSKQKASEGLFNELDFCLLGWSDIAFYVLCVYGDVMLLKVDTSKLMDKPRTKADFSLLFRYSELSGNTDILVESEIEKYVSTMKQDELFAFARRWIVLMAPFKTVHFAFFSNLAKSKVDKDSLLDYFNTEGVTIYETENFMAYLLSFQETNEFPHLYDVFCILPPVIFRKHFGKYVDIIAKEALKSKSTHLVETLSHVLKEPTLASVTEKDFSFLMKVLSKTLKYGDAPSRIASSIWNSHVAHFNDPQSRDYVQNAMKTLKKKLTKKQDEYFSMSQIVVSSSQSSDETFQSLHADLCKKFVECIALGDKVEAQIKSLSVLPENISEDVRDAIRKVIKKAGPVTTTGQTRAQLFGLVTKTGHKTSSGAGYVTSLYVALSETQKSESDFAELQTEMLSSLKSYYATISNEDFVETYWHVLASMENAPTAYVGPLTRALAVLAPLLRKQYQSEHTKLFVATVLAISHRVAECEEAALLNILQVFTSMLSDHMWACTQYGVEIILGLADAICKNKPTETIYIATVNLVSYVVLFHRFRFTSRYHLVVGVVSHIMEPLSDLSEKASASFARLLSALCEPSVQGNKDGDSLTSQAAIYKKALRRHAHILLVNYIHLQLTKSLTSEVNEALLPGIYSVFGVLSKPELLLANQCLDTLGKTYYRTLYSGYKDHGKWKDQ